VATLQVVEPVIPTTNRVLPPEPLPTDPTQPVYLDVQSVKNPGTKARNLRYRVAAAAGWHCAFTIQWDKTVISRAEMETVALDAGRLCGLGDGRNIGYGRFAVETFEVLTDAPPVAAEA
jgi:hypothetical protein